MKLRIRLIHWNPDEAREKAQLLADLGFEVDAQVPRDFRFIQPLREDPPAAILIDLSRAPARGRDVALMIRESPRTRHLPILFMDGLESKRCGIREQIPDAAYLQWGEVEKALPLILRQPSSNPPQAHTLFEVYRRRTLVQKLGIQPGERIALVDAPRGFKKLVEPLPEGAGWVDGMDERAQIAIVFPYEAEDVFSWLSAIESFPKPPRVWICWPKKSSGVQSPLNATLIREIARELEWAEYKVCSIDRVWSGKLYRCPDKSHGRL